ncbi:hypothetical protein ACFTXM_38860 [Streptomyces sp. NPDC056930]|uniref:hypothetical protein n=1 Tax=Streptomyces sp. NPDC056930 TaxID=3345967 RepID=UPI003635129F
MAASLSRTSVSSVGWPATAFALRRAWHQHRRQYPHASLTRRPTWDINFEAV